MHCKSGEKPTAQESLEVKASIRPWRLQSHFDHSGWYMVFRYLMDPACFLETGEPVIIWRVDVVFLEKTDWKYQDSKAGTDGGGRTHTFGIIKPSQKFKDKAIYKRRDVIITGGKAIPKFRK